jgi:hypothetical protein
VSLRYPRSEIEPTNKKIADAMASHQQVIADTDKHIDNILHRAGSTPITPKVCLHGSACKDDDRSWFERRPKRSHRMRRPIPGKADKEAGTAPAGHALLVLLRQVKPDTRLKLGFYIDAGLLPVFDDEAAAHALFEGAVQRETVPRNRQALRALIKKYTHRNQASDA